MAHNSYDSENEFTTLRAKLFQQERSMHEVLGGGRGTIFMFTSLVTTLTLHYLCLEF